MSINFSVHGPIVLKPDQHRKIGRHKETKNIFADDCNKLMSGLANGIGCYLFVMKVGSSFKPIYVGMASKSSFEKECLGAHKILIYNEALDDQKGTPAIFLIAKTTKNGRISKPSKNRVEAIVWLESFLIGMCIEKNQGLKNISKTKLLKEMIVPGILNTPKGSSSTSVKNFKKAVIK